MTARRIYTQQKKKRLRTCTKNCSPTNALKTEAIKQIKVWHAHLLCAIKDIIISRDCGYNVAGFRIYVYMALFDVVTSRRPSLYDVHAYVYRWQNYKGPLRFNKVEHESTDVPFAGTTNYIYIYIYCV